MPAGVSVHLAMCPHFPYILCLPEQCNAGAPGATSGDVAPPATTLTELQRQVDGLGERGQDAVLRFFSDRGAAREDGAPALAGSAAPIPGPGQGADRLEHLQGSRWHDEACLAKDRRRDQYYRA